MVAPWLLQMSSAARAAYPWFQRAAAEGVGADTLWGYLRNEGYELVRSEVREAVGRLRLDLALERYVRELPQTIIPDVRYLIPSATRMLTDYRYTMTAQLYDDVVGETRTVTRSYLSSELLSTGAAADEFAAAMGLKYGELGEVTTPWTVTRIETRA